MLSFVHSGAKGVLKKKTIGIKVQRAWTIQKYLKESRYMMFTSLITLIESQGQIYFKDFFLNEINYVGRN